MDALGPEGVYIDRGRLYTESSCPGRRIYGERLVRYDGKEYREWDPRRSKLSAYLSVGGRELPIGRGSTVLYLGASSGTTPSHVADIARDGKVVCVEFAPRMFRELVRNSEGRPAMMPVLGDATKPEEYAMFADRADVVYQDVAQKRQADILCDNMDAFGAEWGMVAVKARSEDVTAPPERIFEEAEARLRERGMSIVDARDIGPYEKDHEMIVVRRRRDGPHRVRDSLRRRQVPDGLAPEAQGLGDAGRARRSRGDVGGGRRQGVHGGGRLPHRDRGMQGHRILRRLRSGARREGRRASRDGIPPVLGAPGYPVVRPCRVRGHGPVGEIGCGLQEGAASAFRGPLRRPSHSLYRE